MTSRELGYLRDIRDAAAEAAKHVSDEIKAEFPEIDWPGMVGLRNILVHRYQEIDYLELWTLVNRDLEPIVDTLTAYLKRHP